jgi:hypothetical protein
MASVRTLFFGAALLAAACGEEEADGGGARGGKGTPAVAWTSTRPPGWGLVLWVPKGWEEGYQVIADGAEIHFGGPAGKGLPPELIFGWKKSRLTWQEWAKLRIPTPEDRERGLEVLEKGPCRVAGMPGMYCVVRTRGRGSDGGAVERLELDYWFGGSGHIGHVRGLCDAAEFEPVYRPIFEEAAARVGR